MMTRPNLLFVVGLAVAAGFVFLPWLWLRVSVMILFAGLAWRAGSRIRVLPTLMTVAGILLFNLFPPLGRELGTIWGFPVTEGALRLGVERAVTFEGLLMISRATVGRGLVLPGVIGRKVAETFRCFGLLSRRSGRLTFTRAIASIDELLEEIEQERASTDQPPPA